MAVKMYKAALKPCPFCGNAEQTVFGTDAADGIWKWNVECDGCHMETKYYDSEKKALNVWKRRYVEDEVEQDGYRTWRMHLDRYIREGVCRLTGADRPDTEDDSNS